MLSRVLVVSVGSLRLSGADCVELEKIFIGRIKKSLENNVNSFFSNQHSLSKRSIWLLLRKVLMTQLQSIGILLLTQLLSIGILLVYCSNVVSIMQCMSEVFH